MKGYVKHITMKVFKKLMETKGWVYHGKKSMNGKQHAVLMRTNEWKEPHVTAH